jgi:hypothetical protein
MDINDIDKLYKKSVKKYIMIYKMQILFKMYL